MNNLKKRVLNLILNNWWKILRLPKNKNEDIDVFITKNNFQKIKSQLEKLWLVCIKNEKNTFSYIKFLWKNNDIVMIDFHFHFHFHYIFYYFPDLYFKSDFIKNYLDDSSDLELKKIFNFTRYLFLLRSWDKYYRFLEDNFELINIIDKYLTWSIFRKKLKKEDLKSFLNRRLVILLKYLKFKYIFTFYFWRIKEIFWNLFSWKVIVLDWPDGSWKTTLLKYLNKYIYSKYLYCWKRWYKFEQKYKNSNFMIQKLYYLTFLIEDLFRILQVFYWRNRWYIVFCDRYPKYATYLEWTILWKTLYYIYNIFFPNPDKYIFINVDNNKIRKRKEEEYDKKNIQQYKDFFLKNKKIIIVENNWKIEDTLNKILRTIFISK